MLYATGCSCVSFVLKFLVLVWLRDDGLEIWRGRLFWNLISCYFFMLFIFACYYCMISGSWILYYISGTFFCSSLDEFLPVPTPKFVLVLDAFWITSYCPLGWKLCCPVLLWPTYCVTLRLLLLTEFWYNLTCEDTWLLTIMASPVPTWILVV